MPAVSHSDRMEGSRNLKKNEEKGGATKAPNLTALV